MDTIPVIDIFAGPGGLAEGFSAFQVGTERPFRLRLSVEKDIHAHKTLELRSFFRQFPRGEAPDDYYDYLRGKISRGVLFERHQLEAEAARNEAWQAELGSEEYLDKEVDSRIENALAGARDWVLIGGPPCQAYSTAGRSRNKNKDGYIPEQDQRHFLYKHYLRIIARHQPSVFVMENVRGLLSAKINGSNIFEHILEDLHDPCNAVGIEETQPNGRRFKYTIHSLTKPTFYPPDESCKVFNPSDFLIMSENYGIPQARHRLILLGIRDDFCDRQPELLKILSGKISTSEVLDGLPRLRSGLSREDDSDQAWQEQVWEILGHKFHRAIKGISREVQENVDLALAHLDLTEEYGRGGEYIKCDAVCEYRPEMYPDWYIDERLGGVCNSTTKTHMVGDLHRYLFAAAFAEEFERSPSLPEFPKVLWPNHKNAHKALRSGNFSDRFRVQLAGKPSTTIMSHIAKDGHYYIHYDPSQCRSLTVREAARLQTFPDNYFFEGNKTQQYSQVGNAVPPLLAMQIAEIVHLFLHGK